MSSDSWELFFCHFAVYVTYPESSLQRAPGCAIRVLQMNYAKADATVLHFANINATFRSSPGNELSYAVMIKEPPNLWSVGACKLSGEAEAYFELLALTDEDITDPDCHRIRDTAVVGCRADATVEPDHRYNYTLRIDQNVLDAYVSDLETGNNARIGRVALGPEGVVIGPFPTSTQFSALDIVIDYNGGKDKQACQSVSLPAEACIFNPLDKDGMATTEVVDPKDCSDEMETVLQTKPDDTKIQFKKRMQKQ